jgi:GNAT superfamily N-acetyltransferase
MVNLTPNTLPDGVHWSGSGEAGSHGWRLLADHLMTLERGCLGWQSSVTLEQWWRAGLVNTLWLGGDVVGYSVGRTGRTVHRVFQIAVRRDARRIENATLLLAGREGRAREEAAHQISLWCAADIEAVVFWEVLGFRKVQERYKNRTHSRVQYRYSRMISRGLVQPRPAGPMPLFGGVPPTVRRLRLAGAVAAPEFERIGR